MCRAVGQFHVSTGGSQRSASGPRASIGTAVDRGGRTEDGRTVISHGPAGHEATVDNFRVHGWMRLRAVFSRDEATAMRSAAWRALANVGIRESDPSTWLKERPEHLQQLKADPAFRAV